MKETIRKLKSALASIASLIQKKDPKSLAEANGMLSVIDVIATETLNETADETVKVLPRSSAYPAMR